MAAVPLELLLEASQSLKKDALKGERKKMPNPA
jgi:hypothetical protein